MVIRILILLMISVSTYGQMVINASPPGPYGVEKALETDDFDSYSTATNLHAADDWSQCLNIIRVNDNSGDKRLNMATTSSEVCAYWSTTTFDGDHYAELTIDAVASGHFIGPAVRCQSGSSSYYTWYTSSTGSYLGRVNSGSWTTLASGNPASAGEVMRLEVEGYELRCYIDDALETSIDTDGKYTDTHVDKLDGGYPGVGGYGNNIAPDGDDWEGGDL